VLQIERLKKKEVKWGRKKVKQRQECNEPFFMTFGISSCFSLCNTEPYLGR